MLIRSQDKKSLLNLNMSCGLMIEKKPYGYSIYAKGFGEIGTYSTEEKAIKVLDMIQNAYEYIMTEKQSYTFEIPTDSEVQA